MNGYNEKSIKKIIKEILEILTKEEMWNIPVGVSNRHLHISKDDLEVLFGENYKLTKMKDLNQPGEFAAKETVIIKGPKGKIDNIRILGPIRENTQIEIALSDGFEIGVKPQVRESGKIKNTPEVELIGPKGKMVKREGLIAALRHIHMPTEIGDIMGLKDKEVVDVEIKGIRKAILGNVLIRISDKYRLEMHVDTDEANACYLKNGDSVKIKKQ